MTIEDIVKINTNIKSYESKIAKNAREFMKVIFDTLMKLETESEDGVFKLGQFNDSQFKFNFFEYEITVTNMDIYASPISEFSELKGENPSLRNICDKSSLYESYSGCISLYFYDPKINNYDLIYLNRIFITKNFDIAFQGYQKHTYWEAKDVTLTNLKGIIVNTLSELFTNFQHFFPSQEQIMQVNPEVIKTRRFSIGFK